MLPYSMTLNPGSAPHAPFRPSQLLLFGGAALAGLGLAEGHGFEQIAFFELALVALVCSMAYYRGDAKARSLQFSRNVTSSVLGFALGFIPVMIVLMVNAS